jgi:hypothetical protein
MSIQALMHIIMLCTLLPAIHRWLNKSSDRSAMADLSLSRGSVIFLILGALWMGLAGNSAGVILGMLFSLCVLLQDVDISLGTVVFALGAGFAQAVRSFATSLVAREHIGVLYMMVAIVDGIGSLIAPLFFAWTLSEGLKPDAKIKGLPFVLAALFYGISAVSVWCIRHTETQINDDALPEAEPLMQDDDENDG